MGADLYFEGRGMEAIRKASEMSVMHWDLFKTISWVARKCCPHFIEGVDVYEEYEQRTYIRQIDGETVYKDTYWQFVAFWKMWVELSHYGYNNGELITLMDRGVGFTYGGKEFILKK